LRLREVEDENEVERDKQRAEVFDALGHPTRIVILKALSEGPLGFADLKKKTAIDSSGHLQHHLTKLNGLIKTDEYGKYCLSDQGRDALLTVQTVENASPKSNIKEKAHRQHFRVGLKPVAFLLMALLIASSAIAVYEYNQAMIFQEKFSRADSVGLEAMAYYNEFGVIPTTNANLSYSPPISMYEALLLAFEADGLNKTSLSGMNIDARLTIMQMAMNGSFTSIMPLTKIPSNYSDGVENGIIYRYVWQIVVENSTQGENSTQITLQMVSLIDASTGQIIPDTLQA
jgi:DNA-binding HxlR family transcriptional regulator